MTMQNDYTPPLAPEQLAAAQMVKLNAQAAAMAKADSDANGGNPSTRIINGELYHKQYGVISPREGAEAKHPTVCVSWWPDCVVTGEFEQATINAD